MKPSPTKSAPTAPASSTPVSSTTSPAGPAHSPAAAKARARAAAKAALAWQIRHGYIRHFHIFRACLRVIKIKKARRILLFIPLGGEVDLTRFKARLARHCELYAPRLVANNLKLVKLRMPYQLGRFKIRESANSHRRVKIDLAIVPALAVDAGGARLGWGWGFYDRLFAGLGYAPPVLLVGAGGPGESPVKSSPGESPAKSGPGEGTFGEAHDLRGGLYFSSFKAYIFHRGKKDDAKSTRTTCWDLGHFARLFHRQKNRQCQI